MKRPAIMAYLLILIVSSLGCNYLHRRTGNEIVVKIEQFKKTTGRLPNALSEIGVQEVESCPCDCKTSNQSYILWYGTTLGEPDTYDSRNESMVRSGGCSLFFDTLGSNQ